MRIRRKHRAMATNTRAVDLLKEFELGIDLGEKYLDVKKLFLAGFGKRVMQRGLDPEDVLQEVYKGLLVRNRGRCPWDRNKATMGYYVHMVSSNILSNYVRKKDRISTNETIGWRGPDGDYQDVADSIVARTTLESRQEYDAHDLSQWVVDNVELDSVSKKRLLEILPLLIEGYTKREISRRVGMKNREVEALLGVVRGLYRSCSVVF